MAQVPSQTTTMTTIDHLLHDATTTFDDDDECFRTTFRIFDNFDHKTNTNTNSNSTNEELETIMREYNEDFDFGYIYTNVDDEEMIIIETDPMTIQTDIERNLSQNLSQLSTTATTNVHDSSQGSSPPRRRSKRSLSSTPSTPNIQMKKSRLLYAIDTSTNIDTDTNDDDDQYQEEQMLDYLQISNIHFRQLIDNRKMIAEDDLQQLAILQQKIMRINFDKTLWTIYFKSSVGQWETEENRRTKNILFDRRLWPMPVKKILSKKLNKIEINEAIDDQKICENFIDEHLLEINRILEDYQHQYHERKQQIRNCTNEIDEALEVFLRQQPPIRWLRLKLTYKIVSLQYQYDIQLLEREYLALQPSENQIDIAQRLCDLRYKHIQAKHELIEIQQQIHYHHHRRSAESETASVSSAVNKHMCPPCLDDHQQMKDILEERTDSMIASIIQAEDNIQECQQLFNEEMLQQSGELTGKQIDLVYRRFRVIDKKLQYIHNLKIKCLLLQSHFDMFEDEKINLHSDAAAAITSSISYFSPSIIVDTATTARQLTYEQLKLLNRGPTYIPPCQIYVSSSSTSQLNEQLQKQYKSFQHDLNIRLNKFQINTALSMFVNKQIKDTYMNLFSTSLPSSALHRRALYEKQLVESIREQLKVHDLILRRTADENNTFYLGNCTKFEEKAHQFMSNTTNGIFEECHTIDETNLRATHDYLMKINKEINTEFEILFPNRKTHKDILEKIWIETTTTITTTKMQLPYLYFLPNVSTQNNEISLKPIVVASQRHSTTTRLARFLDKLLRPIVQCYSQSQMFVNGADFLRKFHQYIENKKTSFHSKTMFIRATIANFHMLLPHGILLSTLRDFLVQHVAGLSIEKISLHNIVRLAAIFLHNNRFYYSHKIYRFAKGSPSCFAITELLSTIFLLQWQQSLLREPLLRDQFYGRCHNEIFFTCNESVDEFRPILQKIENQSPDIGAKFTMGQEVQFFDVHLVNDNGTLYTCVHHDSNVQKYTLPYVIDNASEAHSHWLRSALIRAVRYCTSVFDFNQERIYLEITCLTNGYSVEFVEQRIHHFFKHFDALALRRSSSLDQRVYEQLRHRLFNFIHEQQQFSRANQELESNNQQIRLSYFYQYGPKHKFNEKLKEILLANLHLPANVSFEKKHQKLKILLTTKQKCSLNALLSQQKPDHPLLN